MIEIKGNIFTFGDIHFGKKSDSPNRLRLASMAIDHILEATKNLNNSSCIFLGDWFDSRTGINTLTMNIAIKQMERLAAKSKVYFIVGNHDMFNKTTCDINSSVIFSHIPNVTIISKQEEVMINGKKCLFAPFITDTKIYNDGEFFSIFGHIDVSPKYLEESYTESNMVKSEISEDFVNEINNDPDLHTENVNDESITTEESQTNITKDFLRITSDGGIIFTGHIHQRKEFQIGNKTFIQVGAPYQHTMGEIDSDDGIYVINEKFKYKFIPLNKLPKHMMIKVSDIMKSGCDKFKYNILSGNIIKQVYDEQIDMMTEFKIKSHIEAVNPFEILNSEYAYNVKSTSGNIDEAMDSLKSSKWDYLESYINKLGNENILSSDINKDKMLQMMKNWYESVGEE